MYEKLHFLYQVLTHFDGLILGYEITAQQPNGRKQSFRYLYVGKNREMEVDLGLGQLLKSRNGNATMFRKMRQEEL